MGTAERALGAERVVIDPTEYLDGSAMSVAAFKGARFAGQSEPAIGPRNQS